MRKFLLCIIIALSAHTSNAQWQQTNGPFGGRVNCVTIIGANIFAGTYNGVFKSTNNGISWSSASNGMPSGTNIMSFAVCGTTIFAGSGNEGVYVSYDNGITWTNMNLNLSSMDLYSLAMEGTTLFAGSNSGGMWVSNDSAYSWTAINVGITDLFINAVGVAGTNLFAGTPSGLFISTDSGATWTIDSIGLTGTFITSIVVRGTDIFVATGDAGVFLSTNGGASWTGINTGLTNSYISSLAISGADIFAVSSQDSVFISATSGGLWTAVDTVPTNSPVYSLTSDGTNIFAGTGAGVFLSTSNGTNWTNVNINLASPGLVNCMATSGTKIYAATAYGGLYVSTNNGNTWIEANDFSSGSMNALAISGTNIFAGGVGMILSTTTIGSSWNSINTNLPSVNVTSLFTNGSYIYAGTDLGPFVSSDNGSFWSSDNFGGIGAGVTTLASNGSSLFAGGNNGILYEKSGIGSAGWYDYVGFPFPVSTALATVGTKIYLGTDNGIYYTPFNPLGWSYNDLSGTHVYSIALSGANVLAATSGGVFLSPDNGTTWSSVNDGLMSHIDVRSVVVNGTNVFVGTADGGVFIRSLSDILSFQTLVWPGDANHDSIVDNNDLLPIGLYYSQTGILRNSISNLWQADSCANWGTIQSNMADIKHADCNGDGLIDNNDTLAINMNFSLSHAIIGNNINDERSLVSSLYIVTSASSYNAGDWVDAEVWMGNSTTPVSSLYGIAFNINYDASFVQPGTESLSYPNSWLGIQGTNAIKISKIDAIASTAYAGITRIDHLNANGFGKIASFKFQTKSSIVSPSVLHLSVSNYKANDSTGAPLIFNTPIDSITINPWVTGITETNFASVISISPNPFTSQTTIDLNTDYKNATLKIVDVLGKELKSINFIGKQLILERDELKAGMYFIQIISENKTIANRKIIIR